MKAITYKGRIYSLPDDVSITTLKEVVAIAGGYTDVVQPMLHLLSRKLKAHEQTAVNRYLKYQ